MTVATPNLPAVLSGGVQQNFDALNGRLGATELGAAVTALPTSAQIGESCLFEAATGVYWHLVYTGEATYPWAKIGGPALYAFEPGSISNAALNTWIAIAPSIKTPLKGEYKIGAWSTCSNTTALAADYYGFGIGGVPIGGEEYIGITAPGASFAYQCGPISAKHLVAAGVTISSYYNTNAATMNAAVRALEVDPLRVG